jgi:hypothetical protein
MSTQVAIHAKSRTHPTQIMVKEVITTEARFPKPSNGSCLKESQAEVSVMIQMTENVPPIVASGPARLWLGNEVLRSTPALAGGITGTGPPEVLEVD